MSTLATSAGKVLIRMPATVFSLYTFGKNAVFMDGYSTKKIIKIFKKNSKFDSPKPSLV